MGDSDTYDLFVSGTGAVAHPASPAGAGGAGSFRAAGGGEPPRSRIPSPESPAGRYTEWRGALSEASKSDAGRRDAEDAPLFGQIAVTGLGSVLRIPVPGAGGLAIELWPRAWVPKGGSTSTLFIQDVSGKRQLRLDYGFNKQSGAVEWHWNQKGTYDVFGIPNHTSTGAAERALGVGAKTFRYAGRALVVAGIIADTYSIVVSNKPLRRSLQVVSAWSAAWLGCESVGAGGAWVGTGITPGLGTAIGGLAGCAVGAFIGYATAEAAAGYLYDWAEDTIFTKIQAESGPAAQETTK